MAEKRAQHTYLVVLSLLLLGTAAVGLTTQLLSLDRSLMTNSPANTYTAFRKKRQGLVSCNGSTCTVHQQWGEGCQVGVRSVRARTLQIGTSINMYTTLRAAASSVRPGGTLCLDTRSDGEVIGLGSRFYDSPPVVFSSDGVVIAKVSDLVASQIPNLMRGHSDFEEERVKVCVDSFAAEEAVSTWHDEWKVILEKKAPTPRPRRYSGRFSQPTQQPPQELITCVTGADFTAKCSVDPSTEEQKVTINLLRYVEPFTWNGKTVSSGVGRYMQYEGTVGTSRIVMSSSIAINIDPSAPLAAGDCGNAEPTSTPTTTPSPTVEVTPTPPPLITTPPTISPTYTSPPPPTEGDSEGPPVFHEDAM